MTARVRPPTYRWGDWEIDLARRELRSQGAIAPLGARPFEILAVLVQADGELVDKYDLIDRVWPGATAEDNTLHAHISAVRRAFGADRELLKTVSGRGYRLLGTWSTEEDNAQPGATDPGPSVTAEISEQRHRSTLPNTNLPQPVSELIGRDTEILEILRLSPEQRLVSLTGTGGIGKTRLAFDVARRQLPRFADGVWVAELAPLSDPDLVPITVATALGLELTLDNASPQSIANALGSKQIMLVLDNCEHVLDAAARMAELLLRANLAMHVLATSREPLRTEGEWVYRVPPLAVPVEDNSNSEDQLRYGAVRLFHSRARAAATSFSSDLRTANLIAAICRRLDGIPLAIELAAARAASLGIEEVASGLDDLFRLLAGGRRTALPRHQTLRETLNWSYGLLTGPERVALRRLAIFAGPFTMDTARAVITDHELPASEIFDCVANLVAKSLVVIEVGGAAPRHRLLETTRAYALEHLTQASEVDTVARRHAQHYLDIMSAPAEVEQLRAADAKIADHGPIIGNVRAALDWAFSPAGDAAIGVALTAAAVSTWLQLSLVEECRRRVDQALTAVGAGATQDRRYEMQLLTAFATSLLYSKGAVSEATAAGTRAFEIAENLSDVDYQLRSLGPLWACRLIGGQHRTALASAQEFHALAARRQNALEQRAYERMIGTSHYFLGDLHDARRHLEQVFACAASARNGQTLSFMGDDRISARAYLARVLWLQGLPEQAVAVAENSVAEARAINHVVSEADALLTAACPIALWVGDLTAAERYVNMLLDYATRHAMESWRFYCLCNQAFLASQRGQINVGLQLLRAANTDWGTGSPFTRFFSHRVAEVLGSAGEIAEGLSVIEETIVRSKLYDEHWAFAETLRIKGELLLSQGERGAAKDHFLQAIGLARQQGALSWELRAATSLARMRCNQARQEVEYELLSSVYDRFTEGFATADLRAAKALIDEMS